MKAFLFLTVFIFISVTVFPQQGNKKIDTTDIPKEKVIDQKPVKKNLPNGTGSDEKINPFIIHTGKIIRSVRVKIIGFESDINDTTIFNKGFVNIANSLHKNTRLKVAQHNLFFAEGNTINPYLLADNERYLREQPYFQDALIIVNKLKTTNDSVDVIVLVKDVFSFGPGVGIGGTKEYKLELKEENIGGSGSKIAVSSLWEDKRQPKFGWGAEFLQRNIRGSFINWGMGYQNYSKAFNSNRNEETIYYARVEKPLVSQYLRWIGTLDLSYNKTSNAYVSDSLYRSDYQYSFYNIDGWFAYNFGAGKLRYKNLKSTTRKFIAFRAFHQQFGNIPQKTRQDYDGTYSNTSGLLGSFSFFKQNFNRATFVYGFGRNEDIPEGFSLSLITGYSIRQDSLYNKTRLRLYHGIEAIRGHYNKKGFYSFYTFKVGSHLYKGGWQDFDLLFNVDHFTRLKQISTNWYKRFFIGGGITKQFSPVLEQPLFLKSQFGLPYFEYGGVAADFRATSKAEIVFYHTKKFMGFRIAPFAFGDMCLLKPTNESLVKSDLYSAVGGGFRIRNENLLFGTIEMRASYFPRIVPGMNHFKIKFDTNLRYKYNNTFIRRPDFVTPN